MWEGIGIRPLVAIAVAAIGIVAGALLGAPIEAVALALVAAIAGILIALGTTPVRGRASPPAPPVTAVGIEEVLDAMVEPVLIVSANRVRFANPAAQALLGGHILGEDVRMAIRHPAAAERLTSPIEPHHDHAVHLVGLGAREQRWEMHVRAAADGQRIVHLIDRTGSYATDRIRVDFVANASHELRTPLASILGFVETLRDEAGDEPAIRDRFLKVMFDEASRMRRLVDDLMSLSRIEAEKYRAPDRSVDLEALVEEVRSEIVSTHNGRASDLIVEIGELPPVTGDRAQLSQLLHNVVGNAMKYGRPGTPVTLAVRYEAGPMVRITVSDEGEGIAPEHLPRLTERFYRVDSGRSRAMGGTGLGLAIVKHIVERHRGRFDIASTPGVGSTVTILLPREALSSKRNVLATQAAVDG
ncbi:ATP-binding protein [Sphingomonas japonica]|uniref:histidine kinase n=1 Tax=Sphingomonas japonica TaxID=511662 RepID=A0ABX0TX92_9SPHN|nr:ATP-binding protein [Sphingomonas japonica]NIJ22914.1 two-component system phosphate regulon sensor histidine kinase PhoR [Sphingomonas japonica]